MRLLVIDDAPALRASFGYVVAALGHSVVAEAASAAEARIAARSLAPDAIVVDGRLGGADVVALIAALRRDAPAARVFVVAALDETALVRRAVASGAAGALLRPLSPAQIGAALRRDAAGAAEPPA